MQQEDPQSPSQAPPPPDKGEYEEAKKTTELPPDFEEAHPFDEKITAKEEPQEERDAPSSSGSGGDPQEG